MNVSFSTRGWQQIPWEQQVQMAETMRFGGVELYNVHKTPELTGRGRPAAPLYRRSDGAGALAEGPVHPVFRYRLRHRGRGLHRDCDSPHAAGARRAVSVCLRDCAAR